MSTQELSPAQAEVLRKLPERLDVERMHRLWIFSPHQGKTRESGLIVVSMVAEEAGMRGLHALGTLRYYAEVVKGTLRVEELFTREGWAPAERIERVIAGVLARGGDEAGEPLEVPIEGEIDRWNELLERFGLQLDPTSQ